jgi:hypothetical protein
MARPNDACFHLGIIRCIELITFVESEVLTAAVMERFVFYITPCSPFSEEHVASVFGVEAMQETIVK